MQHKYRGRRWIAQSLWVSLCLVTVAAQSTNLHGAERSFVLHPGDHICYIGNTLADRMQHHGWLETYLHATHPQHQLTFRNLGFSGDEVVTRPRSDNFGSPDQWLEKCRADVVFCFFGYNESLRGPEGLSEFEANLAVMIDGMLSQKYNGESPPRLVLFSPIAHENLQSPHLPDGSENNQRLALVTAAMKSVCETKDVLFVDLFTPTQSAYAAAEKPLTMNGIHLLDHGNQALARIIFNELYPNVSFSLAGIRELREAVLEKNYYWFSRYRVVDGYNVFGGRSKLEWHGQSNADVMRREMEIFDIMTANWDERVWAVARGDDLIVTDNNIPELLQVKTNKPGPLPDGAFPYLEGEEAIEKMQMAAGMRVNLFACEKMFPRLINPVQISVDTDSRLWASVWPSYPHWNPTEPRRDALVILPDEDRDGVADDCILFADELNSITGFEFWGGGVLVAAPPEIWFLQDTDGDDRADVKIRMLQGVSSADTHHSANAMLIGPDGWFYWSRGIFNTANFETPTRTYRSGASGVHRFNPRTFEVEFHFPVGPNPHGDVFDQWGYQFASDGTSGTGSYVNIGKGLGNKQWFEKRVRPVPATGILSSSHFPPSIQGNFLISNAIGFLGVLQHVVQYNGADITATEIEPIVVSSDPNFRPSDLEIGGDGALYVSDWHNALIGHMQHNMRDPNRDNKHGRIYRITYANRPLLSPVKMKDRPIHEVCEHFFAKENSTRYRARLELSGRESDEISQQVTAFANELNPLAVSSERDEAQALLECLWVFEEHRVPNMELLNKVFQADEPRVRAAAIRTLGHWAGLVSDWEKPLIAAAHDSSALVRAEAVKASVELGGTTAAEVVFEVSGQPVDPELESVLAYARGQIDLDAFVEDAVATGRRLSAAAYDYALRIAPIDKLLRLEHAEPLCRAIIHRQDANADQLGVALDGLATATNSSSLDLLLGLIAEGPADDRNFSGLGELLARHSVDELRQFQPQIEALATGGNTTETRRFGYVAWIAAHGLDDAYLAASQSVARLGDFLSAVPAVEPEIREALYAKVEPLIFDLPAQLSGAADTTVGKQGIQVEFFDKNPGNVSLETLAAMTPQVAGIVSEIKLDVPQREKDDGFALRFSGMLQVPMSGNYIFATNSDDGSRLYIGSELVVDNDGLHGMAEKSASIDLPAGPSPLVVTYFDNGGEDGLQVSWEGPGIARQPIPTSAMTVAGSRSLQDIAIDALAAIPGHDTEKVRALASLVNAARNRPAAIQALLRIPAPHWPAEEIGPLVDNLIGYLTETPARFRTAGAAADAMELCKTLAATLTADEARTVLERLENLDVRLIAIGTVPHRMIFDKEQIVVQAGKPVEFRFSNTDAMPHNFAIAIPGTLAAVGELAEATGRDEDAMERHYIPESDSVLLASQLLQPGTTQALSFEVPLEPGVYPYVCTYPGHWRRMHGALYVVPNLAEYRANSDAYLTALELPIQDDLLEINARGREWKFDELVAEVKTLRHGRSFEVGKQLFKVASCVGCHRLNDEGRVFGPDLAKLDPKKRNTEHILRSLLEPSHEVDPKFQTFLFEMESGKIVTGMVLEETADEVQVVVDPLAKDKPTLLAADEIEERVKSKKSLMPAGLLNKLSREEILDLIAYVYAGGDKKSDLFAEHHHH